MLTRSVSIYTELGAAGTAVVSRRPSMNIASASNQRRWFFMAFLLVACSTGLLRTLVGST
jgi:hypothetical protein